MGLICGDWMMTMVHIVMLRSYSFFPLALLVRFLACSFALLDTLGSLIYPSDGMGWDRIGVAHVM
jgi:hypothetical protein